MIVIVTIHSKERDEKFVENNFKKYITILNICIKSNAYITVYSLFIYFYFTVVLNM